MTNDIDTTLNSGRVEAIAIAMLGISLGILALFRAGEWFDVARQPEGQGIFIIPLTEIIVFAKGGLVLFVAALYFVFAIGAFFKRPLGMVLGLFLTNITILAVLSLIPSGLIGIDTIAVSIVSVLLIFYLLSARGRRMFAG